MKMKQISMEKVTVNVCLGNEQEKINKTLTLLQSLTGAKPIKTLAKKRIPTFDIRPGLPIGAKVTLRGEKATKLLKRLLEAIENTLTKSHFDDGTLSFGIDEYIKIPDSKYDVELGIIGLSVSVTLKRPGFSLKNRRIRPSKIPIKHRISKQETMDFMKENFKTNLGDEDEL